MKTKKIKRKDDRNLSNFNNVTLINLSITHNVVDIIVPSTNTTATATATAAKALPHNCVSTATVL